MSANFKSTALSVSDLLITAAWFGLVTGLVEGISLLILQTLRWANWTFWSMGVAPEVIWASTLFDFLIFTVLGLGVALLGRLLPRVQILVAGIAIFSALAFFDWLVVVGRMRHLSTVILSAGLASILTRWFQRHTARALHISRRTLPWIVAVALFAIVEIQSAKWIWEEIQTGRLPRATSGSPNIVFIVADTLRADHLTAYGYSLSTSPFLSDIAQDGVLFENAFAASAWTLPSHASMFTGHDPHEHRAETAMDVLNVGYPTIAEALRARGYRTGGFSSNVFFVTRRTKLNRGFIHFEDYFTSVADTAVRTVLGREFDILVLRHLGIEEPIGRKRASDLNQSVLRWIDQDRTKHPFFVFVNYFGTHRPYQPIADYHSRLSKPLEHGADNSDFATKNSPNSTERAQSDIETYDGAIANMDKAIRELMLGIERRGLAKNTLLIVTSDHGELLGEHGLLGHGNSLYREAIWVPLILHWPGHLPEGMRITRPITTNALPATLMDLVGEADQNLFPGPSLVRLWTSPHSISSWPLPLSELAQKPLGTKDNPADFGWLKSIVGPDWHCIVHERFGPQLFNLGKDPHELNDLAHMPKGQIIAQNCAAQLRTRLLGDSSPKATNLASQLESMDAWQPSVVQSFNRRQASKSK